MEPTRLGQNKASRLLRHRPSVRRAARFRRRDDDRPVGNLHLLRPHYRKTIIWTLPAAPYGQETGLSSVSSRFDLPDIRLLMQDPESFITAGSRTGSAGCVMKSLFSFPVGLLHSYNMPVQPGAPRIADDAGVIAVSYTHLTLPTKRIV